MGRQKAFDKIHHLFAIKTLNKVGLKGTHPNIIKAYKTNSLAASYSMGKNYKCSP